MCPLLAQLIIGFFSFLFAAAVYSTNEANNAGLKQSIFLDVYGLNYATFVLGRNTRLDLTILTIPNNT
jgi:hypothetical protein